MGLLSSIFKKKTVLIGLIDHMGSTGSWSSDDDGESKVELIFNFLAFKDVKGVLKTESLKLIMPTVEANIDGLVNALTSLSVVEVKGDFEEGGFKISDIVSSECLDDDLDNVKRKELEPVLFETNNFGTLVKDKVLNTYEGIIDWAGNDVSLQLVVDELQIEALIEIIEDPLFQRIFSSVKEVVERDILDMYNETWREENPRLDIKSFLSKMNLSSINIISKEHIEFWYNDCKLFEEHSILVAGDFENGFTEASIQG